MRAHQLVFFVGQRQGRGHCDAVAGVDAHRVHVFDGTDNDGVVGGVPHNFHLIFFPTQKALIHKDLRHGGCFKPAPADGFVVGAVISNAAACTAQRKRRANDGGQANVLQRIEGLGHASGDIVLAVILLGGSDDGGFGVFDAETVHRLTEQFAILGHFDGCTLGTNQLNAEFFKHTHIV